MEVGNTAPSDRKQGCRLELYVELHHVQPIAVPDELYSVPVPVGSSQMTMAEFGNSAKPFQLPLALSLVTAGDR